MPSVPGSILTLTTACVTSGSTEIAAVALTKSQDSLSPLRAQSFSRTISPSELPSPIDEERTSILEVSSFSFLLEECSAQG